MRTRRSPHRELLLEVEHNGFRCIIHRSLTPAGAEIFIEESDLPDCSRPQSDDMGYPVHFGMKDAWSALTAYTSPEGMVARRVWHQGRSEWIGLTPVFIHSDLRPLVQRSLAQVTRDAAIDHTVTNSIGQWLRALSPDSTPVSNGLFNHLNTYRHAS
ncbi:MAG: hypothetical protein K9J06_15850 [Flavobacteriales bacterium]|nr:hypothetical protein [Flavobacteriales bacterium]